MPKRSRLRGIAGAVILCMLSLSGTLWAQGFQRSVLSADVIDIFSTAVGDFDGDGDEDIFGAGFTGYIGWLETRQDRTRGYHEVFGTTGFLRNVSTLDWNHDSRTDILLSAYAERKVYLLTPRQSGNVIVFDTTSLSGFGGPYEARAISVAGLNEPQIGVADFLGNTFRVFRLVSGSWVQVAGFHPVFHAWDLSVVDFDADGDLDAVVGCDAGQGQNQGLSWFEQVSLNEWLRHDLNRQGYSLHVAAGDLDRDGDIDLATSDVRNDRVQILWREGTNFTATTLPSGGMDGPRNIEIADFNQDSLPDIVAISGAGQVVWWRQSAGGSFTQANLEGTFNCLGLTIADYDQDSDPDLLVCETQQDQLLAFNNLMGIPAVIRGQITSSLTGVPVANARVRINETGVSSQTDVSGLYRLATIPGIFSLEVTHPCYWAGNSVDIECVQGDSTIRDVALPRPQIGIEISSLNLIVPNELPTQYVIPVDNSGDGELVVETVTVGNNAGDSWLAVSPDHLTIPAFSQRELLVTIAPDTSNSQNWDYYGAIRLFTNSCPDTDIVINVNAFVLDAPAPPRASVYDFGLQSIYPNPFNASTRIEYSLPTTQQIRLSLFDIQGREALRLFAGEAVAGKHKLSLDGARLATGVYVVKLAGETQSSAQKIILLK